MANIVQKLVSKLRLFYHYLFSNHFLNVRHSQLFLLRYRLSKCFQVMLVVVSGKYEAVNKFFDEIIFYNLLKFSHCSMSHVYLSRIFFVASPMFYENSAGFAHNVINNDANFDSEKMINYLYYR